MDFPIFKNDFLNDICCAFKARSKSIGHRGNFSFDTDLNDDFEWISFYYQPLIGPYLILQATDGHKINYYIRSPRTQNRGKVLLALENLLVVGNGKLIVEVFEWAADQSVELAQKQPDAERIELIKAKWRTVCLQISDSGPETDDPLD
jgi:hypothetical protein